jgi:processive 1,2-diacylglycerol beta-glucosyltransferase
MWLYRDIDWYFTACEETALYLEKLGIPKEAVHLTGIPIDPLFARPVSKENARRQHGLASDRFTLLVSAGGFGVGPVEFMIRSLDEMRTPVQMIVVCGKNARLKETIEKMPTRHPVKAIGFTTEMDTLMAAADILVGKAGGLTSSEAFARGLIAVVWQYRSGKKKQRPFP